MKIARIKSGQKKSDARIEVENIVNEYLKNADIEFQSTKIPNLPVNKEGKINMSQLSKDMGLSKAQRKNHMYKDGNIIHEINRHAIMQQITPLNQSKYDGAINETAKYKIVISNKRAKQSEEQPTELQSQNEQLIIENRVLKAKNRTT